VRDGASTTYALFLKSRIVGENPLQIDKVFRKIKAILAGTLARAAALCAIGNGVVGYRGKSV